MIAVNRIPGVTFFDIKPGKKELHTGNYCNLFNHGKNTKSAFIRLYKSSIIANKIGLDVHAGHGLTYKSASQISKVKEISEFKDVLNQLSELSNYRPSDIIYKIIMSISGLYKKSIQENSIENRVNQV